MGNRTTDPAAHRICVFAPMLHLTVTVETGDLESEELENGGPADHGSDHIHVHPGGQGFWIARMLRELGEHPTLCGGVGGEIGTVLSGLIPAWGIDVDLVSLGTRSAGYIHDRRSGNRQVLADQGARRFDRHDLDDLYGKVLAVALSVGCCVVTGSPTVPASIFERLGADLASGGVRVFGDLHGEPLAALLRGGPIELLKVSHEDLSEDGWAVDGDDQVIDAIVRLRSMGVVDVVVSRADLPSMAWIDDHMYLARPPALEVADHLGAGDSMTAGLVAGRLRSLPAEDLLRLGSAAGAANVTRHGLGSASADLIAALASQIEIGETTVPRGVG